MKCCDVHAGLLRKRVSLQELVKLPDGGGGFSTEWVEFARAWAYIKPLSGTESLVGMQLEDSISHDIMMRYRSALRAKHRVVYDGREFNIISVINVEERDKWSQLRCQEGTAQFPSTDGQS